MYRAIIPGKKQLKNYVLHRNEKDAKKSLSEEQHLAFIQQHGTSSLSADSTNKEQLYNF
jgi:hypothetical protein